MNDFIENFICPIKKVKPMESWVQGGDDEQCRPCHLSVVTGLYITELNEAGHNDQAKELEKVFNKGDFLEISKKLDKVKSVVGETVKSKLVKIDCLCQTHEQDA